MLYGLIYGFGYDLSKDDYLFGFIRLAGLEHEIMENGCYFFKQPDRHKKIKFTWPQIDVLSVKTNVPSFIYVEDLEYVDFCMGSYLVCS